MTKRRALPGGRTLSTGHKLYWWAEILAIAVFYFVYSSIRNATEGGAAAAMRNAERIIRWQRALGINYEETLQDWALHFKPIVIAANYFYGSLHFVVTIGAGIWLYQRWTDDYPRFRNALAVTTALALIGFITFPLKPPRLLPESYGFRDTLVQDPTFWSFNSGAVSKISNQFAAMPSVHVAWATWCAVALYSRVKRRWVRLLAVLYPILTVVVIIITGNHYILDAVGGLVVFALGMVTAGLVTRAGNPRYMPTRTPTRATTRT